MFTSQDNAPARLGAHVIPGGVNYRVWAPDQPTMDVFVEGAGAMRRVPLQRDENGFWSAFDAGGRAGDLYRYRLGGGILLPDVASRFQPEGVHGRSECIAGDAYGWQCADWRRPGWRGQTTYEIHIGTWTRTGTFRAAQSKLAQVRDLGAEAIEIMPLADFAGARNWGYDGVDLFSPARCYGRPDDLRALVDAAHACGLAIILDVVYNHVGPQGNYLHHYCADYFRTGEGTPWGRGFNLDGYRSGPVRELLVANAAYWLDEFRVDGLRLDATHAIQDASPRHLVEEIAQLVHTRGGFVIAEDERNNPNILRLSQGRGWGIDAAWADDFHHEIRVALTGTRTSYFSGYKGNSTEIAETLAHGWTYRGQPYPPWQGRPRGSACASLPAEAFVDCIENHDQVGNRIFGERLEHLVTPAHFRAASMLLCLGPYPPLIFMGQEWAASTPFLFFSNHGGELGARISAARQREFAGTIDPEKGRSIPDPEADESFESSKLRWEERGEARHAGTLELYRECLRERNSLARARAFERGRWKVRSAGPFVALEYRLAEREKMLAVTFQGAELAGADWSEIISAPAGKRWRTLLDSEAARFGGAGEGEKRNGGPSVGPRALWLEARKEEGSGCP